MLSGPPVKVAGSVIPPTLTSLGGVLTAGDAQLQAFEPFGTVTELDVHAEVKVSNTFSRSSTLTGLPARPFRPSSYLRNHGVGNCRLATRYKYSDWAWTSRSRAPQ